MGSNQSGTNTSRVNYEDTWQPLDPNSHDGASEFDWGPGQTPPGLENAPPSAGGMYRGQSPPNNPQIGVSRR
jgi:hypothetical protein